ncbi:hypothetical protein CBFG_05284 [Clostridiales bacterium 1_7_47FAA]|nr:hypothetical protein CBFG_05284 [Clostridiales bacterium 1_7_47FAA]
MISGRSGRRQYLAVPPVQERNLSYPGEAWREYPVDNYRKLG